jgi:tRNA(Ile)-lysidine synthase
MGATATPRRADPRPGQIAVAASGGRDSTALLHATLRAARPLGLQVHALHVQHGLHPQADAWAARVQAQCRRWGARFHLMRLAGRPAAAESVEAWARRERYAALATMAHAVGCDAVLLAQHRRDQAETVLLQLMRGAGARGLAAMPRAAQREGITWLRPWRDRPREAIEAYLRRHRLSWVDDASNDDPRFARNRLRQAVWPALEAAFPGAEAALAFAAMRAADEAAALGELAAQDATTACDGGVLLVRAWLALSPARRALLLRLVVERWTGRGAPETLVRRLLAELPRCPSGEWPAPGGVLRLRRGRLAFRAAGPASVG